MELNRKASGHFLTIVFIFIINLPLGQFPVFI